MRPGVSRSSLEVALLVGGASFGAFWAWVLLTGGEGPGEWLLVAIYPYFVIARALLNLGPYGGSPVAMVLEVVDTALPILTAVQWGLYAAALQRARERKTGRATIARLCALHVFACACASAAYLAL